MTPRRKENPDKTRPYTELFSHSLGLAAAALTVFNAAGRVKEVYGKFAGGNLGAVDVLALALLLQTLLLGLAWYVSGKHEIDLLRRHFEPYFPPRAFSVLPLILSISITIVLLVMSSPSILVYAAIFVVYSIVTIFVNRLVRRSVSKVLADSLTDKRIPQEYRDEMTLYYTVRQNVKNCLFVLLASLCSVALAMVAAVTASPPLADRLRVAAYAVMILTIFMGEVVVWTWRRRLYTRLRAE